MNKLICFLFFAFFLCITKGNTQVDTTKKIADTIVVNKDPRLDVLTQKQAIVNKRSQMMTSNGLYKDLDYNSLALTTEIRHLN